tara:strand:+ start:1694 stop:2704 length:1011 start_codon:yes stop_codon:yes gene_type:complete
MLAIAPLNTDAQSQNESWLDRSYQWFNNTFNTYDSTYVQKLPFKYMVGTRSSNWLDAYNLEFEDNEAIALQSDLEYNVGLSLGYRILSFNYNFNVANFGSGKGLRNRQLNVLLNTNSIVGEFNYMKSDGEVNVVSYRNEDDEESLDQKFDGLRTTTYGADLYYYFNKKKYSNAAAYSVSYRNKQIKSAGSFIVGLSYAHQYTFLDIARLSTETDLDTVGNAQELNVRYNTVSLSAGYGYSFVFAKQWLLNFTGIPSVGIKFYESDNDEDVQSDGRLDLGHKLRMALVYNREKFFASLGINNTTDWYFTENYTMTNSLTIVNLSVGLKLYSIQNVKK